MILILCLTNFSYAIYIYLFSIAITVGRNFAMPPSSALIRAETLRLLGPSDAVAKAL